MLEAPWKPALESATDMRYFAPAELKRPSGTFRGDSAAFKGF